MYVWIWRHLPGPLVLRILLAAMLLASVILLLLFVIFPWVEPQLPWNDVTVSDG